MIIDYKELTQNKDILKKEVIRSLTAEVIDRAAISGFFDIKLLINGVELEPVILSEILLNIDKVVEERAVQMLKERFSDAHDKTVGICHLLYELEEATVSLYKKAFH